MPGGYFAESPTFSNASTGATNTNEEEKKLKRRTFLYPDAPVEPESLTLLKHSLQNQPQREDYAPNLRGKIVAALLGAAEGARGGAGAGMAAGRGYLDRPFNAALADWHTRAQGLEGAAGIEERGTQARNQYYKNYNDTVNNEQGLERQNRLADLSEENIHSEIGHRGTQESIEREKMGEGTRQFNIKSAEEGRHNRSEEGIQATRAANTGRTPKLVGYTDPKTGAQRKAWLVPGENPDQDTISFDAPLSAGDMGKVSTAHSVMLGTNELRAMIPRIKEKIGPVVGRGENLWQKIGASTDPDVSKFKRGLDALEMQHAGIFGRSSVQMVKMIKDSFGGLGQTDVQLNSALDAMEDQAKHRIKGSVPGAENMETTEEEKTNSTERKTGKGTYRRLQ